MAPSDSSRGGDASIAILCATLRSRPAPARSPVFSACRSPRAVPATPEESLGASAEHLPETCSLRPVNRGSASSILYGATSGFAARYGPWFRSRSSADARHAGPASTGCLAASRRGPRYPLAQRFVGVGSFHPTRHTLLHGAHSLQLSVRRGWRTAGRPARRAGATRVTSAFGAEDGWGCRAPGPAFISTQVNRGVRIPIMSRINKVNKDNYVQRGRLTPDEMARERMNQAQARGRAKPSKNVIEKAPAARAVRKASRSPTAGGKSE